MPARLRGIRIVLAEDHDDSRELLALMLEPRGADVVSASSARTGLQAVLDNRPDVVVSDLGMPGEDGGLINEVLEYLNKPVDPERLCGAVAKVLDRSG